MSDGDGELHLGFDDLLKEMASMPRLATPFITKNSVLQLQNSHRALASFKSHPLTARTWEIPREQPLITNVSKGLYEDRDRNKQKSPSVFGKLSFVWHLRMGPKPVRKIFLCDNASTELQICAEDGVVLCKWQMDIGQYDSPGCCFHVQLIDGDKHTSFPKGLPIPRFPSYPPTPMICLEFLLAELFQKDWRA